MRKYKSSLFGMRESMDSYTESDEFYNSEDVDSIIELKENSITRLNDNIKGKWDTIIKIRERESKQALVFESLLDILVESFSPTEKDTLVRKIYGVPANCKSVSIFMSDNSDTLVDQECLNI